MQTRYPHWSYMDEESWRERLLRGRMHSIGPMVEMLQACVDTSPLVGAFRTSMSLEAF